MWVCSQTALCLPNEFWAVVFWCHTLLSIASWKGRGSACKEEGAERETDREEWDQRARRNEGEVRTTLRLPRRCGGQELACQCRRHERRGFNLWVRKIPSVGNGNHWKTPRGQKSLMGYSPWSHRVAHNWGTEHSTAQREHGQEKRRRKRQGTEVFFKEIEEAPWWLESWVSGRHWGEREESRWVKRMMAWIDFNATVGKLKLLFPLPWLLWVRLNTNGQWFNHPWLYNEATIKPKVTGFGEFPGW